MNSISLNLPLPHPFCNYVEPRFPNQRWRLECFYDMGYKFLKEDGEDLIVEFKGGYMTSFVRIYPNGEFLDEVGVNHANRN